MALAPPNERASVETAKDAVRYFHNDIDERPDSEEEAQRCRENGWILMIQRSSGIGVTRSPSTNTPISCLCLLVALKAFLWWKERWLSDSGMVSSSSILTVHETEPLEFNLWDIYDEFDARVGLATRVGGFVCFTTKITNVQTGRQLQGEDGEARRQLRASRRRGAYKQYRHVRKVD